MPQQPLESFKQILKNMLDDNKLYFKATATRYLELTGQTTFNGNPVAETKVTISETFIDAKKIPHDADQFIQDVKNSKSFFEAMAIIDAAPNLNPKTKDKIKYLLELHELVRANPEIADKSTPVILEIVNASWDQKLQFGAKYKAPADLKAKLDKSKNMLIELLEKLVSDTAHGKAFEYEQIAECFNADNFKNNITCSYLSIFSKMKVSAASLCQEIKATASAVFSTDQSEKALSLKNLMSELNANTIIHALTDVLKDPACQQVLMLMIAQSAQQIMGVGQASAIAAIAPDVCVADELRYATCSLR